MCGKNRCILTASPYRYLFSQFFSKFSQTFRSFRKVFPGEAEGPGFSFSVPLRGFGGLESENDLFGCHAKSRFLKYGVTQHLIDLRFQHGTKMSSNRQSRGGMREGGGKRKEEGRE